ncbi:MAG: DNA translocase FtsK [Clostridiales bacterium]|nr:DNA translocase FtsK [Clostridiales bacterium]
MGMNPSALGAPEKDIVLSGGVIGGSIALALREIAAKVGALIILCAFTLSQIVLIFNISISDTAVKTANAIRTTSQKASEALRQDRALREKERMMRERGVKGQTVKGYPSFVKNPTVSPFEEVEEPQGFIDLDGTDVKMNQPTWEEREKSFDFDLLHDEDMAPEARKVAVPPEPRVDISFSNPKMPEQTVKKEEDEPQWIDLPPLPNEGPRPGQILPSPKVSPNQEEVVVRVHEQGGTQIRVPDLNGMEPAPSPTEFVQSAPLVQTHSVSNDSSAPDFPGSRIASETMRGNTPIPAVSQVEETRRFVDAQPSAAETSAAAPKASRRKYSKAPTKLLSHDQPKHTPNLVAGQDAEGMKLVAALKSFGIETRLSDVTRGPAITRFEVVPAPGIKVSRITSLSDDIALALAARSIRIEAPIPGKSAVGIEVPNKEIVPVNLGSLLDSQAFRNSESPLTVALGKDIPGSPILCDLAKMPHLLIAGATGSGKSVCINSILISILCHATPQQVRMIMVDPKVVELAVYNGIPHLLCPVVTDAKKAANALNWAVREMTDRYAKFAEASVRDFKGYNEYQRLNGENELPLILVVIDELADLMQVAAKEVEESISRLTAMARAAGIHLLIATQRPSVDVITGVIKANIPSRIAFAVSSQVDSRTILDMVGAEKLLGKGDMLYYPQSAAKPLRGQGALVTDKEVEEIIGYIKKNNDVQYDEETAEAIVNATKAGAASASGAPSSDGEDEFFNDAVDVVIETGYASVSLLQRRLSLGYPRASRLIDRMAEKGYIGPFEGSKPRKVLIDPAQWLEIKAKKG